MNNNFWKKLNIKCKKEKRPILALAPMAGFTDSSFRQICRKQGADVVYSELASATALVYNPKKTLEMLISDKKESPYVIQLFGANPDHFAKAVKLLSDKKTAKKFKVKKYRVPEGFDINFGCGVKKVLKQGAGAALMKNIELSRKVIKEVLKNTNLPVSIKTRTLVEYVDILKFIKSIEDLDIKAIMIHGRTLSQGFSGPVDNKIIKNAKKYFKGIILANGGINNYEDGLELWEKTETDGIGVGRGALGKPWIFRQFSIINPPAKQAGERAGFQLSIKEIFDIILKHAKLVNKNKGNRGIIEMRSHL